MDSNPALISFKEFVNSSLSPSSDMINSWLAEIRVFNSASPISRFLRSPLSPIASSFSDFSLPALTQLIFPDPIAVIFSESVALFWSLSACSFSCWGDCPSWTICSSKRGFSEDFLCHVMNSTLSFCSTIPSCKNLFWKIPIWISFWSGS